MQYKNYDIGGEVVKQDERYTVIDNKKLNNLVVSSTALYPGKSTSGHSHTGQEEVYFFIRGNGQIELNNNKFDVAPGDTVLIEDGVFHRVHNTGDQDLYFICVFDGKRNH